MKRRLPLTPRTLPILARLGKLTLVGAFLVASCTDLLNQFDAAANCAGDLLILAYGPYANDRIKTSYPARRDRMTQSEFTDPLKPPIIVPARQAWGITLIPGCGTITDLKCEVDLAAWDGFATSPPNLVSKMTVHLDEGAWFKRIELEVNPGVVNDLLAPLGPGQCDEVAWWLRAGSENPSLPAEIGGFFGTTQIPLQIIADPSEVGPFFTLVSICKEDSEPAPSVTLSGFLGPDLQDEAFADSGLVPPHAPLIFTFDQDMAWATAMVSFADGSIDLLSRQAFSGNFLNRFEIIPNDGPRRPCTRRPGESMDGEPFSGGCGLGFTPGQTVTLQMLDRNAPIRGFPNPASSVALDGEALESPGPIHVTISDIRIDVIADATHFNPAEFAVMTGPWFLGVIDSVPGAVNTLVLATQSVNAAGHPAVPDTEPFEFLQSALPAGETVFGLDPPSVRSGYGLLQVYDVDRPEHLDYAFYSWQPPVRILTPADGNDQQLRDEVVVNIVVPAQPVDVTYRLTGAQVTDFIVFANQTSATAVVDLPFQWSTFTLTDNAGTPFDARTVRISEGVVGIREKVWRVCEDQAPPGLGTEDLNPDGTCATHGPTLTDAQIQDLYDNNVIVGSPTNVHSVDDIWTGGDIQHVILEIQTVVHPTLSTNIPNIDDMLGLGFLSGVINVYYVDPAAVICCGGTCNPLTIGCAPIGGSPHTVVSSPTAFTEAHEFGHIFSLTHASAGGDPNNLMYPNVGGTALTTQQVGDARSSGNATSLDQND